MPDVVITYESLYEILRREKYRAELQKLDPGFFQDVLTYLMDKQAILASQEGSESIFASAEVEKTRTQLKNVQRILKELYEKREGKIMQLAIFNSRSNIQGADVSPMLPEEVELFASIRGALDSFREGVLFRLFNSELPRISVEKQKGLKSNAEIEGSNSGEDGVRTVRFKCSIPQFVGSDLNVYGPFSESETAALPQEVVGFLVRNNQAEVI